MDTNKFLAGLALMAGMSGVTGCLALTTTQRPVVEERMEIVVKDGKTTTNTTAVVEMKSEYNCFGKACNAVRGGFEGLIGGIMVGHELGTDTNNTQNATFWDKSCSYVSGMGKGIYNGVKIGATAGLNRSKEEEEKAAKEAALKAYEEKKRANSL